MTIGFTSADDFAASTLQVTWFRPVLALSYALNRHVGLWIATNVLIHLVACALVFLVSQRFGHTRRMAATGAILLAICPLAADAVWSVAGRSSMLCAVFCLAAVLAMTHDRWILCGALALLAAGVKEEAIALVPLLSWMSRRRALIIPGVLGFLAPACARLPESSMTNVAPGRLEHALRFVNALGHVLTGNMGADPYYPLTVWTLALGVVLMITLAACAWRRHVPAAMALFLLAAYMMAPLPDVLFEHRLYFALAAGCIWLGAFLSTRQAGLLTWYVGLAFAVCMAGRVKVYSSPTLLWQEAVQQNYLNVRAHANLGGAYAAMNQFDDAEREAYVAYSLRPDLPAMRNNLVFALVVNRKFGMASALEDSWR